MAEPLASSLMKWLGRESNVRIENKPKNYPIRLMFSFQMAKSNKMIGQEIVKYHIFWYCLALFVEIPFCFNPMGNIFS